MLRLLCSRQGAVRLHPTTSLLLWRCASSQASFKPKAVAFDMGGVVIPSPFEIFGRFEAQHGLPKGAIGSAIRAGGDQGNAFS